MMMRVGLKRRGGARLIIIGIGLSVVFWFLEALLHVLVFDDTGLVEQIADPQLHEVWMRLTVMSMFIAFGVYAQHMVEARSRAEEAARLAHTELNQIFETAADGMRVVDREFNVLRANQTFATLVGRPKEAIVGNKCHELFGGPSCGTPDCPINRVLARPQRVEYDGERRRPDGVEVPCLVTATPFRRPDGEIIGIVEDFKDISERKRAERELLESHERLRELTSHLQLIREGERTRIAREIHDQLGQALTALNMDVHWLRRKLPAAEQRLRDKTAAMSALIGETVGTVRRICSELRPGVLDELGLAAAIEWQAGEFSERTGIPCDIRCEPADMEMEPQLATDLFRILQETLTNIMRHARARRVEIRLTRSADLLELRVCDDGIGMEEGQVRKANSFGLIGIRERVRDRGGELRIGGSREGGTCIEVRVPLPGEGAEA